MLPDRVWTSPVPRCSASFLFSFSPSLSLFLFPPSKTCVLPIIIITRVPPMFINQNGFRTTATGVGRPSFIYLASDSRTRRTLVRRIKQMVRHESHTRCAGRRYAVVTRVFRARGFGEMKQRCNTRHMRWDPIDSWGGRTTYLYYTW